MHRLAASRVAPVREAIQDEPMTIPGDAVELHEKAAKCRRLANRITDRAAVAALENLADGYDREAREAEGDVQKPSGK